MSSTAVIYSDPQKGSGLDMTVLRNILYDYRMRVSDLHSVISAKQLVKFVYYDGILPHRIKKDIQGLPCEIKNYLQGHEIITDKKRLHMDTPPEIQAYLAPTILYSPGVSIPDDLLPAIIRPNRGFSGRGITVIDSASELPAAVEKAQTESKMDTEILISRYQRDILLFKGKKFHCRFYMLLSYVHGEASYEVWDRAEIMTSRLAFNPDARDEDHVDTHGRHTEGDIDISALRDIMPDAQYDALLAEIKNRLENILMCALDSIKPYEESANGYEILAADILILSDMTPMIIEVNDRVGFHFNSGKAFTSQFTRDIFEWINTYVYAPWIHQK